MSLNYKEIERLAQLSRLAVSPAEQAATLSQLNGMLALFEQLSGQDTTGVEPLAHPVAQSGMMPLRLRDDRVTEADQRAANQRNAPAVEGGLFLVPRVLE
ncbi:MAG: Asp-tRNA(Asn)/Glu-tRNA(Gln) amidotransferase subunit GatC [Burkholderiaceae bacterium]